MNGFCNFVKNDSSSNDLLFRISAGFIFWLFRLLESYNVRFGCDSCRFTSVLPFITGLKGADSKESHPSCPDMKLRSRVEFSISIETHLLSFCTESFGKVAVSIVENLSNAIF